MLKLFRNSWKLSYMPRRYFCSENINQQQQQQDENLKTQILKAALLHVNRVGWNDKALALACQDLGLSTAANRIVTRGAIELVEYVTDIWQERLGEDLKNLPLEEHNLQERLKKGVQLRLSYQIPYLNTWHQAIALGAHPFNLPQIADKLFKISDTIWYVSGDNSFNINWYAKRIGLLGVYTTTELYMLTDKSNEYKESWYFLERRINDMMKASECAATTGLYTSVIAGAAKSLLTVIPGIPRDGSDYINKIRESLNIKGNSEYSREQQTENDIKNQENKEKL